MKKFTVVPTGRYVTTLFAKSLEQAVEIARMWEYGMLDIFQLLKYKVDPKKNYRTVGKIEQVLPF